MKPCIQAGEDKVRIIRTLEGSKDELRREFRDSEAGRALKAEGLLPKRSAWYEELKENHYEMHQAHKRVDVCDTCLMFDRKGKAALRTAVVTSRSLVKEQVADYFAGFDPLWKTKGARALYSSSFLEALETFIRTRREKDRAWWRARSHKAQLDLKNAEKTICCGLCAGRSSTYQRLSGSCGGVGSTRCCLEVFPHSRAGCDQYKTTTSRGMPENIMCYI